MRTAVLSFFTAAALVVPSAGWARCIESNPALAWSFPALIGGEVPSDGVLWWMAHDLYALEVDGVALPLPEHRFDAVELPELEPGVHELRIAAGRDTGEPIFETGSFTVTAARNGLRGAASAPVISTIVGEWPTGCWSALNANDCYDTGQDTFVVFEVEAPGEPVAWWVHETWASGSERTELVPAECGSPRVFRGSFRSGRSARNCYALTPLYPNGPGERGPETCVPADESKSSGGCMSANSRASAAWWIAALGCLLFARSRVFRRRQDLDGRCYSLTPLCANGPGERGLEACWFEPVSEADAGQVDTDLETGDAEPELDAGDAAIPHVAACGAGCRARAQATALTMLAPLALLGTLLAAADADASCAPPESPLTWSHPSLEGGVIAADGVLWLLPGLRNIVSVEIDDVALSVPDRYDPIVLPELAVGEHTVTVGMTGGDFDPTVAGTIVVGGETGTPRGAATAPEIRLIAAQWPSGCYEYLNSIDCYDEGQDTYVELTTSAPGAPVAWWVHDRRPGAEVAGRDLVPADCGPPRVFRFRWDIDGHCFSLTPLYPNGAGERGPETCWTDPGAEVDAGFPDAGGDIADVGVEDTGTGGDAAEVGAEDTTSRADSAAEVSAPKTRDERACQSSGRSRSPTVPGALALSLLFARFAARRRGRA